MKKLHQDVFVGIGTLLFAMWATLYGLGIPEEPGIVPVALAVIMMMFSACVLGNGVKKTLANDEIRYSMAWTKIDVSIYAYLAVVLYTVLFFVLGYFTATFLFLTGMMLFLKAGSWKKCALISISTVAALYILFVVLFGVNVVKIGWFI